MSELKFAKSDRCEIQSECSEAYISTSGLNTGASRLGLHYSSLYWLMALYVVFLFCCSVGLYQLTRQYRTALQTVQIFDLCLVNAVLHTASDRITVLTIRLFAPSFASYFLINASNYLICEINMREKFSRVENVAGNILIVLAPPVTVRL